MFYIVQIAPKKLSKIRRRRDRFRDLFCSCALLIVLPAGGNARLHKQKTRRVFFPILLWFRISDLLLFVKGQRS